MRVQAAHGPRLALLSLVLGSLLALAPAVTAPAAGTYGVNDYPNAGAQDCSRQFGTYSWCVDANRDGVFQSSEQWSSRGFAYRNCTDFAAWRTGLTHGGISSGGDGNARAWRQGAIDRGYKHGPTPAVGAVAWWGVSRAGGYGHVAIVTSVNNDGTANIEQYNGAGTGTYSTQNGIRAEDYLYIGVAAPGASSSTSSATQTAFQANTGDLWTAGSLGIGDQGLGLMNGTSPSVASVNGGYQIAFQANTGDLWTTGSLGSRNFGLGMMRGTSPSIAAVNGGAGYQIAFQANTGNLWTAGSLGIGDQGLGLMKGTSPDS